MKPAKTLPHPPSSRIGQPVRFKPPVSVSDGKPVEGKVVDELWSQVYEDDDWGYYVYTSQLIAWSNGGKSVRLTYYYQPPGKSRWIFGGQFSISDRPKVIRQVLADTLAKDWYGG